MRTNIKPLARLIVHTLLAKADNETAVVPLEFTPSLTTLEAATGLSRSAVAEHLAYLEGLHWVKRSKPPRASRDERTQYTLFAGQDDPRRASSPQGALVREADGSLPAETESVVRDTDHCPDASSPPHGLGVVRDADHSERASSPPHGPATSTTKSTTKTSSSKRSRQRATNDNRPDVEEICTYLADKIRDNGSKRPTITKTWRDEGRRLIDIDGRTVEQIRKAIDWCQDDTFWRPNIMSMEALRKQYDRLRLAALAGNRKPQNNVHRNPIDDSEYDQWSAGRPPA